MLIYRLVFYFPVFASLVICVSCETTKYPIIEQKCGLCHSTKTVYYKKRSKDEWNRLIYAMKQRGLTLTDKDEMQIKNLLYKNF